VEHSATWEKQTVVVYFIDENHQNVLKFGRSSNWVPLECKPTYKQRTFFITVKGRDKCLKTTERHFLITFLYNIFYLLYYDSLYFFAYYFMSLYNFNNYFNN
jgi:hypothetical protein